LFITDSEQHLPKNLTTTRNVGQQDMRKDGSGLVARSRLSAEQEKAVREEWRNAYELRNITKFLQDDKRRKTTNIVKIMTVTRPTKGPLIPRRCAL
jgi:hypothetical protein